MLDSNRIRIKHSTAYIFDRAVFVSPHSVRLRPAPHCLLPIHAYELSVTPKYHYVHWQLDAFNNHLARYVFSRKTPNLIFDVELDVEMVNINPFDFFVEETVRTYPFNYSDIDQRDLQPYRNLVESSKGVKSWVKQFSSKSKPTVEFLFELNSHIAAEIEYIIRYEPGVQACDETLNQKSGSCRDSSWLLAQILRHLGFASRFVSGYLVELADPVQQTQSAANLHAWVETYLPGAGWIGLDPTSGLFAGQNHVPLACAAYPDSVAPIIGATEPCEVEFRYESSATIILSD